ncbi:hypothetical protein MCOR34_000337 [Pyricularia oryzae]|nr:hypothetical protein MCOR26_005737 [Pyricularia oryzae]KAI6327835.1 hypothetical protein MCOR34_000337 [Pyricularia oryzae]KAI6335391.1 hypothetical protein MCOR30_003868 [Pyricularia oryzae]KAI6474831.1 hypothetical protein MCOR17_001860 [Pyricularia oryzae]
MSQTSIPIPRSALRSKTRHNLVRVVLDLFADASLIAVEPNTGRQILGSAAQPSLSAYWRVALQYLGAEPSPRKLERQGAAADVAAPNSELTFPNKSFTVEVVGAAASVAGLLSLAIQLVDTSNKIVSFCDKVRNAPSELVRLKRMFVNVQGIAVDAQNVFGEFQRVILCFVPVTIKPHAAAHSTV